MDFSRYCFFSRIIPYFSCTMIECILGEYAHGGVRLMDLLSTFPPSERANLVKSYLSLEDLPGIL
jgi:hypothetical protein